MKKITINIHSFVDVITNSSTEIFVTSHDKTVEMVKDLISKFLKAAGSEKTVDALCKVYVKKDKDNEDNWKEHPEDSLTIEFLESKESVDLNSFIQGVFDITGEYNG